MNPEGVGGLRRNVARGAFWLLAEVAGGEGIALVSFLILSRLLKPADYGVVSIAGVATAFLQLALTRGLPDAVVGRPDDYEDVLPTALWANLLLAAVLFVLVQATAGAVAWCFGQPQIAPVMRWFSICFFTTAVMYIPLAALRRNLHFRAFAVRAVIGSSAGGCVGIGMALTGWGLWSLVGAQIGQGIASVAAVVILGSWRPRLRFSLRAFRLLAPFSLHSISGSVLEFCAAQIDVVAVGLFLDATSVGYYYLLKRVLTTVTGVALYPAWFVTMPVLTQVAGDPKRFNRAYVSLISVAQACWVPIILGLGISARELIPSMLGAHWEEAVPLFQVATLLVLGRALTGCTSQALCAAGHARLYTRIALGEMILTAVLVAVAARFGATAAVVAVASTPLVMLPVHLTMLRHSTRLHPPDVLRPLLRIAAAGLLSFGLAMLCKVALLPAVAAARPLTVAFLSLAFAVVVYVPALRLLVPDQFGEWFSLVLSAVSRVRVNNPATVATDAPNRVAGRARP